MRPLVVSFYAQIPDQDYKALSYRMTESCRAFDIETHVVELPDVGCWTWNCAQKGPFVQKCLREFKRPILWVDADALIHCPLTWLEELDYDWVDFAAYWDGTRLCSGTLLFNYSPGGLLLVDKWAAQCIAHKAMWDQISLALMYRRSNPKPHTAILPQGYCKIFDRRWRPNEKQEEVIVHHQASRSVKAAIRKRRKAVRK